MPKQKYVPTYPDPDTESSERNISGRSPRENVLIEEAAQRAIAENQDKDTWLLARKLNGGGDSRPELEAFGFVVVAARDDLFYEVQAPQGWGKSTEGY